MNAGHHRLRATPRGAARAMLSGIFLVGGLHAARYPDTQAGAAAVVTAPLARALPVLPANRTLVRLNGLTMLAAGLGLGLGVAPRAAALVLAATLVPTTLAGHRFWTETDPAVRAKERIAFLDNVGLLGGLLTVAIDRTTGAPS